MKKFRLPDRSDDRLESAAEPSKVPVREAIVEYAREAAGTGFDLNPELEAAGIEYLMREKTDSK